MLSPRSFFWQSMFMRFLDAVRCQYGERQRRDQAATRVSIPSLPLRVLTLKRALDAELRNQAIPQRFAHRFGFGVDVEFLVDAADIVADGVDADVHLTGRVLVAEAFRK